MSDTPETDLRTGSRTPRRAFIKTAATAAAGLTIVPRHVLGAGMTAPSDRLNIAGVGVGGMGRVNLEALSTENIVALCDVDWDYAARAFDKLPADIAEREGQVASLESEKDRQEMRLAIENMKRLAEQAPRAARYRDYREMLDRQKDLDAVLVATPDHMHAPIALAAMDLGKHVYVQKPLTWSVQESRQLARKAAASRVATQMGNQGHSSDDARLLNEYIWAGAIGDVREVHVWTDRPLGYWPQAVPRPEAANAAQLAGTSSTAAGEAPRWDAEALSAKLAAAMGGEYRVPETLAWDLFLGVAPQVPYHPVYHPFNWRGWVDWGVGPLGDMGAHLIDHAMWALDLGYPTSIETVSTPFNKVSYPAATMTFYDFPARGALPPVKLTWYDGGLLPPKPEEIGRDELDKAGGVLFIGSKGKLLCATLGTNPRLLPQLLHDSYGLPPQKLPRVATSHEMNWVQAAKGTAQASSPFDYAARLTEVMLLGIVSLRAGRKIEYDGAAMRVTNVPWANDFLTREYRQGW
jgi:predicted dehydrogenase